LRVVGREVTVEEVAKELERDRPYYEGSGGGVTISGGEPTLQTPFVEQLCAVLKEKNVHVALDTCGQVDWNILSRITEHIDLVLLDIKHVDPERHRDLTGVTNELILANFARLVATNVPVVVRFPLVPGYNDDDRNIEQLSVLLRSHRIGSLEMIPYHSLGLSKYRQLGRIFPLASLQPPSDDYLRDKEILFRKHGIRAVRI
jgi:pyruvate formate lyase activating enzyme